MFRATSDFYRDEAANLANLGTEWSFKPGALHFDSLWKASVKYHLRRILGEH